MSKVATKARTGAGAGKSATGSLLPKISGNASSAPGVATAMSGKALLSSLSSDIQASSAFGTSTVDMVGSSANTNAIIDSILSTTTGGSMGSSTASIINTDKNASESAGTATATDKDTKSKGKTSDHSASKTMKKGKGAGSAKNATSSGVGSVTTRLRNTSYHSKSTALFLFVLLLLLSN
ncbi:hypothetical protein AX774_g4361 [Zancudomyces culisetae]|uniref:Uncharacterized protein n=1 Tax=Zancudomyces culisetae TaxID=1213189 RepID=A0A1R1PCC3_ZANCU|nr:hypothetical protein AX774_g7998 [Zancudomyces culisetae]OMH82082.1 hypothetical protein AX774_g4441 [Zancudomyces culisetae]OMH82164.1 hypothetical protein AX774_g4361 [Zancudomyces culisetae]|eukprot:OMH78610.1 hypothetical protein AX774_g7998 [Zancudomyces culisetae]